MGTEDQGPADEPAEEPNAPMREEMLQNAVTFLSHSQVRGSSDDKKRAFLVQKGLTDAEIEEAFKRVPPAPSVSTSVGARPFPPPAPSRILPPPPPPPPPSSMALLPTTVQRMRWTQMVLAVGALSAGTWYAASCARRLLRSFSSVRELTPVIAATPEPTSSGAEAQAAAETLQQVQQLRTTMTDAISSQNQQLAATTEALEALAAAQRAEAEAKHGEAEALRKEAMTLPETVAKASLAGTESLKEELRRLADSCVALASAATSQAGSPTMGASPIPGELHSELGEIRCLLKQTLRTQSPFHPQSLSPPSAGSLSFKGMVAATEATEATEAMNASISAATGAMASQGKTQDEVEAAATVKAKALTLEAQANAKAAAEVKAMTIKTEAAARAKAITDAAAKKAKKAEVAKRVQAVTHAAAVVKTGTESSPAKAEVEKSVKQLTASEEEVAKRVEAGTQAAVVVKPGTESSPAKAEAEKSVKQLTTSEKKRAWGRGGSPPAPADEPKYSKSYTEVMDMLTAGQTPPGIREIDDRPPNPGKALPTATLKPRPKPWEKAAKSTTSSGGSGALPWTTTAGKQATSERLNNGGETTWKPPPRPGVAMATAAEAMGMGRGVGGSGVGRAPPTAAEKAKGPAAEQVVDEQKTRASRRASRKALQLSDSSSDDEEV